jgi:hypothetical protein
LSEVNTLPAYVHFIQWLIASFFAYLPSSQATFSFVNHPTLIGMSFKISAV